MCMQVISVRMCNRLHMLWYSSQQSVILCLANSLSNSVVNYLPIYIHEFVAVQNLNIATKNIYIHTRNSWCERTAEHWTGCRGHEFGKTNLGVRQTKNRLIRTGPDDDISKGVGLQECIYIVHIILFIGYQWSAHRNLCSKFEENLSCYTTFP